MVSTTLPSIQEMFPDHLLNKDTGSSSKPSSYAVTQDFSVGRPQGCDFPSGSSSSGRSAYTAPHKIQSRHVHPGSAVSSMHYLKSAESAVSSSKSIPTEALRSDPTYSIQNVGSGSRSIGHGSEQLARLSPPPSASSSRSEGHSRTYHSDEFTQRDVQHRQPAAHSRSGTLTKDLPYRSQSRSPPSGSRTHVPYPYPPRPGFSDQGHSGQSTHPHAQTEEDELDSEDYEDNIATTSGTNPNHNSNTSTRKHVCPTCFKRFNRPSSLKIHVNTHTGATPFRCPWPNCGREFNVNSNMRRHYRNHLTPSRNQGIFPLPPPPSSIGHPHQVPALVPATPSSLIHDIPPPPHNHQPTSSNPIRSTAPHQIPNGPTSDQFASDQNVHRAHSHGHSLSAGNEPYNVYRNGYHGLAGHERGREQSRLSSPPLSSDSYHSSTQYPKNSADGSRPSSSHSASHGYHHSSSSIRRATVSSPPMTHSSISDAGNSDVDTDMDAEDSLRGHLRSFTRSQPSHSRSPNIRILDRHHPYELPSTRRIRPPPLPLDPNGMEVDSSSAYLTPASKHFAGVDVESATRRPISPAGSSFRSSSPSPSVSTSSAHSLSRSPSTERQQERSRSSPQYKPSNPYLSNNLSNARVSTVLRPAFA